jgi:hypothetical protein
MTDVSVCSARPIAFAWTCPKCKQHNVVNRDEFKEYISDTNVCQQVVKKCVKCGKEVRVCVEHNSLS